MNHRVAIVFPGQGILDTPFVDGHRQESAELEAMLAGVDPIAAADLSIYSASLAAFHRLEQRGAAPFVLIGHGFGEIAALVAAGGFSMLEGAEIVVQRSIALRRSAAPRTMASIAAPIARVRALARMLNDDLAIAVENSSRESVLIGSAAAIAKAAVHARLLDIPFRRLRTSVGAHHRSLAGSAAEFARTLRHATPRPLRTPVFSPLQRRFYRGGDDLIGCVAEQLARPLHFAAAVQQLAGAGVTLFIECGPLRGLASTLDCSTISDLAFERKDEDHEAGAIDRIRAAEIPARAVA
jgi:acyl transferase domain-containing protein